MSFFNKKWFICATIGFMAIVVVYGWIFLTNRVYQRMAEPKEMEVSEQEEILISPVQTQESKAEKESGYPLTALLEEKQIVITDKGGTVLEWIPIEMYSLPEIDRIELKKGISLPDEEAYIHFLESFAE